MDIILFGASGKMGTVLSKILEEDLDMRIVAGVDKKSTANYFPVYQDPFTIKETASVIIDFSHPSLLKSLLSYAIKQKLPIVIATTGFNESDLELINDAGVMIPIFLSANMSLGINILKNILRRYKKVLKEYDIEIIEKHHNQKLDAPSGTALALASTINENEEYELVMGRNSAKKRGKKEIGIHAIRGGTIVGEHSIIFAGTDEILEFKHTALKKEIFAHGAIKAAKFIVNKQAGLYTMDDIFN